MKSKTSSQASISHEDEKCPTAPHIGCPYNKPDIQAVWEGLLDELAQPGCRLVTGNDIKLLGRDDQLYTEVGGLRQSMGQPSIGV